MQEFSFAFVDTYKYVSVVHVCRELLFSSFCGVFANTRYANRPDHHGYAIYGHIKKKKKIAKQQHIYTHGPNVNRLLFRHCPLNTIPTLNYKTEEEIQQNNRMKRQNMLFDLRVQISLTLSKFKMKQMISLGFLSPLTRSFRFASSVVCFQFLYYICMCIFCWSFIL